MQWLVLVLCPVAGAVDWDSARLGEYYRTSSVEEAELREAGRAVVWFGNATGFIVSPDGNVLTNHHVYRSFGDGGTVIRDWRGQAGAESLHVELVTARRDWDVAVYRVVDETGPLPYLPIRTDTPVPGERVAVIGHPKSWTQRVSYGRVLADDLVIEGNPSVEYSAQTWWGSSGSPVVDVDGSALAIHWGWDAEGLSNGRLTGVPFDQMVGGVPEVRRIAERWGTGPAVVATCEARDFTMRSDLVRRAVATNGHGRRLDAVQLSVASADPACADAVESVTYNLHPTFRDPTVDGDLARAGHPATLHTWGFFEASADVTLAGGERVVVPGMVRWDR